MVVFALLLDMATDQQQAILIYVETQVMQRLAATRRTQEATATQAQADGERGRTQPEKQDSRGSDNLPTDRLAEELTKIFNEMQAKQAEEHQQCEAAITQAQAGNVVFSHTSIRIPAVEDPQQVLIFTHQ